MCLVRLLPIGVAIVAACALGLTAQTTELFVVEPAGSSVTLRVGKSGVFAFAGHDHEIVATVSDGEIALDRIDPSRSRISIRFDATTMKVTGKGEPSGDVPEVQRVMLSDRVLDVQRYPVISFTSRAISVSKQSGERMTLQVAGDLTLHGVTRRLTVPVNVQLMTGRLRADGKAVVRQTEFDIRPVTAGAGTVRVKNEIDVSFSVAASRR
jgi:polyisoprenoid-binding protein YceI